MVESCARLTEPEWLLLLDQERQDELRQTNEHGYPCWYVATSGKVHMETQMQILRSLQRLSDQMPVATEHGDGLVNRHNEIVGFVDEARVRLARLDAQRRAGR